MTDLLPRVRRVVFKAWADKRAAHQPLAGSALLVPLLTLGMFQELAADNPEADSPSEPPSKAPAEQSTAPETSQWPSISLALQDRYLGKDLSNIGVRNDTWCLSQYALGTPKQVSDLGKESESAQQFAIQQFVDLPIADIRAAMGRYVANNPQLTRGTTNTIIIDIEFPVHPRQLWKLMGGPDHDQITPLFSDVVQAFARRFAVVREHYPNAQLTAYGFGSPDSQGREREVEKARLNAEIMATKMGILESVDAISPVIYERFGPAETPYKHRDRATIQGMSNSLAIVQASDRPLDILVLLSLSIFNGSSEVTQRAADLQGLAERLALLGKLGVKRVIFWNGGEMLAQSVIPVSERLAQLRMLEQKDLREVDSKDSSTSKPSQPTQD
ncbi:MAG: hypothetical protein VX527_06220 [Planctomycetota bacterium]|nr:hypothetical protein [Planctomycetota bacterium]